MYLAANSLWLNPLYSDTISLSRASLYIIFSVGKYTDVPPNSLNKALTLSIPSSIAIFSNCTGRLIIKTLLFNKKYIYMSKIN